MSLATDEPSDVPRSGWLLAAAFLAYAVALGAGAFAGPTGIVVNDVIWTAFPALAAWWLWEGARRSPIESRCRGFRLVAIAQGFNALGGVVYLARDVWLGWDGRPWLSSWIAAYYVAVTAGVLCLSVPRRSRSDRVAFALDLSLASVAAAALAWYLVAIPSARFAALAPTDRLWNMLAVGGDAFVFFAISALAWRLGGSERRPVPPEILGLWWTLAGTMAADLAFKHALFSRDGYVAGGALDAMMSVGPFLAAGTGLLLSHQPRTVPQPPADYLGALGRLALPLALMVASALLPLCVEALDRRRPEVLVPAVGVAITAVFLLVVRQAVAERALAMLEFERIRTRQLEAVGRLAGAVSHDFNNLLTAVIGNASLLADTSRQPEDAELLAGIQQAALRGQELTTRLQGFVRLGPPSPELVAMPSWTAEARRLLAPLTPERISVRCSADAGTLAWVDATHLSVLLVNLFLNARDATIGRGEVRIHASLPPSAVPPALGVPAGAWVRLDVSDDGHGMTPGELARASEPFYTTRPPGLGVGLGLVTVAAVVQAAEGHVAFASTPGAGTTVSVFLPRAHTAPRVAPHASSTSTVPFSTA